MVKPPLNGVAETEYTKSQQGGLAPSSFRTTGGVHELVARAMRGERVRQRIKQKSVVLPLPMASAIPRVRTYRTREPSRFVHALSARPHIKVWRGLTHMRSMCVGVAETGHRGSDTYADGIKSYFLLCLFAVLGLYLVGVGVTLSRRRQATLRIA